MGEAALCKGSLHVWIYKRLAATSLKLTSLGKPTLNFGDDDHQPVKLFASMLSPPGKLAATIG
jgi:hypothetical protein